MRFTLFITSICFKTLLWRGGYIKQKPDPSFFNCFDWPIIFWLSTPSSGAGHHAQSPTNIFKRQQLCTRPAALLSLCSGVVTVNSFCVGDALPALRCFWSTTFAAVEPTHALTPQCWFFTLLPAPFAHGLTSTAPNPTAG